jgi:hypothetical protein
MRARYTVLLPAAPDDGTTGMEVATGQQDAAVQPEGASD